MIKPEKEFAFSHKAYGTRHPRCKTCHSEYNRNNRERRSNGVREWRERNNGESNAIIAKYRAAKLRAVPTWFESEKEKIKELYKEARTMRDNGMNVSIDHIVPLQGKNACGLHTIANL